MNAADVELYDSPWVGGTYTHALYPRRDFYGESVEAVLELLRAHVVEVGATDCVGIELSVDADTMVWKITGTPAKLEYYLQSPRKTGAVWPTAGGQNPTPEVP